jgi:alkylated DNA repair dioxygenase AlkB
MTAPLAFLSGDLTYTPRFLTAAEASALLAGLSATVAWRHERITMFGRSIAVPRETAWYGDATYTYSGIVNRPQPWTLELAALRERLEAKTAAPFNSVLLNRYRDGADGMGWHADNEPELGPSPIIASVSLGSDRMFQLRRNDVPHDRIDIVLEHGSLLVVRGETQRMYRHRIPKLSRPDAAGERINLTYRHVRLA